MSRGELINDDNQVKENSLPASGDWAAEYQRHSGNRHSWADEFLNNKACINTIILHKTTKILYNISTYPKCPHSSLVIE